MTYRPKGDIWFDKGIKHEGWTAMLLDKSNEGVLLDGQGQPLKDGEPPVFLPKERYGEMEFNEIDFGELVEEVVIDEIKKTTADAVIKEISQSGQFSFGSVGDSAFVAPHRSRPLTKIILSNAPGGVHSDGFDTRIININLSTPHLEHVLMDSMKQLMRDFIEGKVTIKNHSNENVCLVDLSDSLVDCEPNELGLNSWFDVLHWYTTVDFLDNLAKLLMSVYKIDVAVVPGKECGLVLRREKTGG